MICATALAAGVPRLQENYEVRVLMWAIHRTDLGHNVRHHLVNIPQSYHAPLQLHQTSPSSIVARRNLAKFRIIPSTLGRTALLGCHLPFEVQDGVVG